MNYHALKDVTYNNIPRLTCNGTTYKDMKFNGKEIDNLRKCLEDGSIQMGTYKESVKDMIKEIMNY